MAETLVIKNIQIKRGTKAKLEARLIPEDLGIPSAGEPIFETDTNKLKVGDGVLDYAHLPYLTSDANFAIQDPLSNQILFYDPTADAGNGAWVNRDLVDEKSLSYLASRGVSIKGYEQAAQGQMPTKDANNGIKWVTPVDTQALNQAVHEAQEARDRASQYATSAGNDAVAAHQAEVAAEHAADVATEINNQTIKKINEKFWWGTLAEYNAWIDEHGINPGTFYFVTTTANNNGE